MYGEKEEIKLGAFVKNIKKYYLKGVYNFYDRWALHDFNHAVTQ